LGPTKAIAHVIGAELPEEFIERRVRLAVNIHDKRVVVVLVKSVEKIPNQLILIKRLANSCIIRRQPPSSW
jgi:hypothetical protein